MYYGMTEEQVTAVIDAVNSFRVTMPKVGIVISITTAGRIRWSVWTACKSRRYKDVEIILLDDASPNDSVAQLQDKLPANTVFLPQEQNLGFAAVNNVGMRRALADDCDYVLLLNNDTAVAPDMLETLLRETRRVASELPKMLFMNPPDEIWFAGGTLDPLPVRWKHLGATIRTVPPLPKSSR